MISFSRQVIAARNLRPIYRSMTTRVHPEVIVNHVPFYPGSNRLFEDRAETFLTLYGGLRQSCRMTTQYENLSSWRFPPA